MACDVDDNCVTGEYNILLSLAVLYMMFMFLLKYRDYSTIEDIQDIVM